MTSSKTGRLQNSLSKIGGDGQMTTSSNTCGDGQMSSSSKTGGKAEGKQYSEEELMIMFSEEELTLLKTRDIGYISKKLQKEKELDVIVYPLDHPSSSRHTYFVEDKSEARKLRAQASKHIENQSFEDLPEDMQSKISASYREREARKNRVKDLEKIYLDMTMEKEMKKKGKKRKLRQEELNNPTAKPVYKWKQERKR